MQLDGVYRDRDLLLRLDFTDSDGEALALTGTVSLTFKRIKDDASDDSDALAQVDAEINDDTFVQLQIPAADMSFHGQTRWDIMFTDSLGNRSTLVDGQCLVVQSVTRRQV